MEKLGNNDDAVTNHVSTFQTAVNEYSSKRAAHFSHSLAA